MATQTLNPMEQDDEVKPPPPPPPKAGVAGLPTIPQVPAPTQSAAPVAPEAPKPVTASPGVQQGVPDVPPPTLGHTVPQPESPLPPVPNVPPPTAQPVNGIQPMTFGVSPTSVPGPSMTDTSGDDSVWNAELGAYIPVGVKNPAQWLQETTAWQRESNTRDGPLAAARAEQDRLWGLYDAMRTGFGFEASDPATRGQLALTPQEIAALESGAWKNSPDLPGMLAMNGKTPSIPEGQGGYPTGGPFDGPQTDTGPGGFGGPGEFGVGLPPVPQVPGPGTPAETPVNLAPLPQVPAPGGAVGGIPDSAQFGWDALKGNVTQFKDDLTRELAEGMAARGTLGSSVEEFGRGQIGSRVMNAYNQGLAQLAGQERGFGLQQQGLDLQRTQMQNDEGYRNRVLELQRLGMDRQQALAQAEQEFMYGKDGSRGFLNRQQDWNETYGTNNQIFQNYQMLYDLLSQMTPEQAAALGINLPQMPLNANQQESANALYNAGWRG